MHSFTLYLTYCAAIKTLNSSQCSYESIEKLINLILKHCDVYAAYYARIVRTSPSGANAESYTLFATILYNEVKFKTQEDCFGLRYR